ncbi:MAG TPA: glycosyltransferase family 2 protein [Nocardioidaceae bacterium]|nr:glycosyltransferase family 2 protein [Nocardioidaceae bacterium]
MTTPVGVIMVTYNSQAVALRAVQALFAAPDPPAQVVLVDNASSAPDYLHAITSEFPSVEVIRLEENLGFCAANNIGLERLKGTLHVALINPDAFVTPTFLVAALEIIEGSANVGAVGPKLIGADALTGEATGLIDSAGICQDAIGRFYDRGQGERDTGQHDTADEPAALCAAALVVNRAAVSDVAPDGKLFDERFFMYKEDLDLSFRLRRAGWRTLYVPSLTVLHCRGWQSRRTMPRRARTRSLVNEWRLWWRGWNPESSRWKALPYMAVKSLLVAVGL